MSRSRRPAVVRGFAAATLAIFVALAGHVFAGGDVPGLIGVLVPWVLALMVCIVLAGRRLSVVRLSISVASSQFLFHALFVLGAITPNTQLGHVHGLPMSMPAAGALVADPQMWTGHVAAALVTIAALHRGERMLVALRDLAGHTMAWLRGRLGVVLFAQRPSARRRLTFALVIDAVPLDVPVRLLRRRGPPAFRV
ncbi:hypothetical protein [Microbacterium istanbulense]|uniref:Integral membrane protein n=1 Tax=Microbacterium istanbulense TaxID=3122049 RepID=A0ABU8LGC1_9MICO